MEGISLREFAAPANRRGHPAWWKAHPEVLKELLEDQRTPRPTPIVTAFAWAQKAHAYPYSVNSFRNFVLSAEEDA